MHSGKRLMRRFYASCFILLVLSGCSPQSERLVVDERYNVPFPKARLLFDLAHAHPQEPGGHLDQNTYSYYELTSWHSLLKALGCTGVSSDLLLEGRLTRSLLDDYELLCLFFPEHPAPPLSLKEMDALEGWVRAGGGLFIVGEHHNAGYSSERLNPLLARFGMALPYGSVEDGANAFSSGSWHKCFDFVDHPVTRGVRAVGVRTTGAITVQSSHSDRPVGLMASSSSAFLDKWNPQVPPAFTGDQTRQPDEPEGPFFEMAAATPARGRVVVVADHNVFDNLTVRYVDNLKLALQAWNWLAGEKLDTLAREPQMSILIPETTRPSDIMKPDSSIKGHGARTFYTFFTVLNRHPGTIAHCTEFLDDQDYAMVLVTPQQRRFSPSYLKYLRKQHKRGATIVIMADAGIDLGQGTRQVLDTFEVALGPSPPELLRINGQLTVGESSVGQCTLQIYPWLTSGAEVVMTLTGLEGEYPVIARYAPGVVVVLQAQIFRNRAFQTKDGYTLPRESVKPNEDGLTVYRAVWAWLDQL